MARTHRPNTHKLQVSHELMLKTLKPHRDDADHTAIKHKVLQLMRKHGFAWKGSHGHRLRNLIRFYEKNPRELPSWEDLRLYTPPKTIVFELDPYDNLVEVM